jgi:putative endonuclease
VTGQIQGANLPAYIFPKLVLHQHLESKLSSWFRLKSAPLQGLFKPMSVTNHSLGKKGEDAAADFLRNSGRRILHRNYRTKFGEIDIIALDIDTVCFVEVKTRRSEKFGPPHEAVIGSKQKQISRVAVYYLKNLGALDRKARFDIVSVTFEGGQPHCELLKNAFDLCYDD